ncbi:MAG: hypothetical protein HOD58_07980 [Gammaproteobacteria bacterium]|jgi:O-antigen ligase|nr:hypothetical protein [Gammaproteobacteria bacterium]MBT7024830.1 hypothetical protein [Gammaproteobacteria bacterium]
MTNKRLPEKSNLPKAGTSTPIGRLTKGSATQWFYWLPAIALLIMVWDTGDLFARVNIYKTFLLFVCVSLLFIFVDVFFQQKREEIAPTPVGWLLLLSLPILATLPGLMLHGSGYNYLLEHEVSIHLMYMMWAAYIVRCVKDIDALEKLMMVAGITVIYAVLEGVAQDTGRPKSTFGNTNLYANYLILFLPVLMMLWLPVNLQQDARHRFQWQDIGRKQYYFLLVFLVGLFGLWQTETRAALAGFAAALIVLFLYLLYLKLKQRYQLRGWVFLLTAVGVPLLLLALLFLAASQLSEETVQSSRFLRLTTWEAWSSRLMPWQVALLSIQDSPLLGFGPGSSYNLFFEYLPEESLLFTEQRSYKHAHSEILEVMQEGGIFGLLVHLLVLGGLFWVIVRMLQGSSLDNREKRLVMGVALALVAYNVQSVFSLATRMTQNEMTLYTVIGLLLVLYPKAQLGGRFALLLQRPLPISMPASAGFLLVTLFAWGIQYPTFIGSNQLVTLASSKVKTVEDVLKLTEKYEDTPSIYVLHFLANLQVSAKRGEKVDLLLDRMERMIPHYRDADYLVSALKPTYFSLL